MKVPYVVAIVRRDVVEQIPTTVPAHEVAVLCAVHGQEKVFVDEDADLPAGLVEHEFDPEEEFARLELRYGRHPDTGMSFAAMTFHGLSGFIQGLEQMEKPKRGRPKKETAED